MILHFQKELFIIAVTAHLAQVEQRRYLELGIQILATDPETCQTQQLVMLLLHNPGGAVSVN